MTKFYDQYHKLFLNGNEKKFPMQNNFRDELPPLYKPQKKTNFEYNNYFSKKQPDLGAMAKNQQVSDIQQFKFQTEVIEKFKKIQKKQNRAKTQSKQLQKPIYDHYEQQEYKLKNNRYSDIIPRKNESVSSPFQDVRHHYQNNPQYWNKKKKQLKTQTKLGAILKQPLSEQIYISLIQPWRVKVIPGKSRSIFKKAQKIRHQRYLAEVNNQKILKNKKLNQSPLEILLNLQSNSRKKQPNFSKSLQNSELIMRRIQKKENMNQRRDQIRKQLKNQQEQYLKGVSYI